MDLPFIVLRQSNVNIISSLFSDWRLYFSLMINGFFTGLGVYFANRGWEQKIKEILKKLSNKK